MEPLILFDKGSYPLILEITIPIFKDLLFIKSNIMPVTHTFSKRTAVGFFQKQVANAI